MDTPTIQFIKDNADVFSAAKIEEIIEHEYLAEKERKRQREKSAELEELIKKNRQVIEEEQSKTAIERQLDSDFFDPYNRKPDMSHPYFGYNHKAIENHLKMITPQEAVRFLVECEIAFSKWITRKPECAYTYPGLNGCHIWGRLEPKQIEYLKAGKIKHYVELELSAFWTLNFQRAITGSLLREYKKRAAALPEPHTIKHPEEMYRLAKKGDGCTVQEEKMLAAYINASGTNLNDQVAVFLELNRSATSIFMGKILNVDDANIRRLNSWTNRKVAQK